VGRGHIIAIMRDHSSGQQDDRRSLNDLSFMVVRVSCRACRHSNLKYPIDLKRYQDPNWAWTLTIPRFRCSVCGEKNAIAEAHPLPR
jgi:hypothetical protein